MDLDSSKADKAELWKLIGRDNPAGKALYAIYNGNSTGKEAGQRFTKVGDAGDHTCVLKPYRCWLSAACIGVSNLHTG
jgi:hypothetical protein